MTMETILFFISSQVAPFVSIIGVDVIFAACRKDIFIKSVTDCLQETLAIRKHLIINKDVRYARMHAIIIGFNSLFTKVGPTDSAVNAVHKLIIVNSGGFGAFLSVFFVASALTGEAENELSTNRRHGSKSGIASHLNSASLNAIANAFIFTMLACDLTLKALIETFSE